MLTRPRHRRASATAAGSCGTDWWTVECLQQTSSVGSLGILVVCATAGLKAVGVVTGPRQSDSHVDADRKDSTRPRVGAPDSGAAFFACPSSFCWALRRRTSVPRWLPSVDPSPPCPDRRSDQDSAPHDPSASTVSKDLPWKTTTVDGTGAR